TVRAHALARTLLDRHGVVTRGAVAAEGVEGGFSAVYRVLSAFEDSGQARRGYVVEGLGAAQFAMDGAVDRLRAVANARDREEPLPAPATPADYGFPASATRGIRPTPEDFPTAPDTAYGHPPHPDHLTPPAPGTGFPDLDWSTPAPADSLDFTDPGTGAPRNSRRPIPPPPYAQGHPHRRPQPSRAVVLAAADPANAYGAALGWPEPPTGAGHKPGRKAGSLVVLVGGELTLYMERGGKTLLAWPSAPDDAPADDPRLREAAEALAEAARAGTLGTVTVERVNGVEALTSPFGPLLEGAGFIATPRGLRLRA
ncbi:Lhr family helicase, partial [Streptomyces sp. S6]